MHLHENLLSPRCRLTSLWPSENDKERGFYFVLYVWQTGGSVLLLPWFQVKGGSCNSLWGKSMERSAPTMCRYDSVFFVSCYHRLVSRRLCLVNRWCLSEWMMKEGDSYIKHPQYLNHRNWRQTQMISGSVLPDCRPPPSDLAQRWRVWSFTATCWRRQEKMGSSGRRQKERSVFLNQSPPFISCGRQPLKNHEWQLFFYLFINNAINNNKVNNND